MRYSWQVRVLIQPEDFLLFPHGKVAAVRVEFAHCGFTVIDAHSRWDNLFAVAHERSSAATWFMLRYNYPGLIIKSC